jgi:hypothetical protein
VVWCLLAFKRLYHRAHQVLMTWHTNVGHGCVEYCPYFLLTLINIFTVCILLCITISNSDRITVTTTKTSMYLFILNLASLLHVSVSQGPSSGIYTNTNCHLIPIWIHISAHNRLMLLWKVASFKILITYIITCNQQFYYIHTF